MKRESFILRSLLLLLFIMGGFNLFALTPSEILEKSKAKIKSASTISADFKMSGNQMNLTGKLQIKGSKFAITSPSLSNWYDGKTLYTYNGATSETSIFTPTSEELADINPLLYLNQSSKFRVLGSKTKKAGIETIELIPTSSGLSVKNVSIEIDSKTFLPKMIKVTLKSGGTVSGTISNVKLNGTIADSAFTYPKGKYPKAKIIDYR